jgi:hypothetical protein
MKHLKMIAVAAVAVGALMAMAGASSAFAANSTALCKVGTNPCPAASVVGSGEAVSASSTNALLEDSIVNVTCKKSATELHVSGTTAAPETGTANSLSFSECETTSGTACTVTTQGFPANGTVEVGTAPNGTLTVNKTGSASPGAHVTCGIFINCTFSTPSASLALTGGSPLKAVAKVTLEREGGICPKTATWNATYNTSSAYFVEG